MKDSYIFKLLLRDEEQLVVLAQKALHNWMDGFFIKAEDVCHLVLQLVDLLVLVP